MDLERQEEVIECQAEAQEKLLEVGLHLQALTKEEQSSSCER